MCHVKGLVYYCIGNCLCFLRYSEVKNESVSVSLRVFSINLATSSLLHTQETSVDLRTTLFQVDRLF